MIILQLVWPQANQEAQILESIQIMDLNQIEIIRMNIKQKRMQILRFTSAFTP